MKALFEQNQKDVYVLLLVKLFIDLPPPPSSPITICVLYLFRSATVAGENGLFSGVQLRHSALERNKRCLLAYLWVIDLYQYVQINDWPDQVQNPGPLDL